MCRTRMWVRHAGITQTRTSSVSANFIVHGCGVMLAISPGGMAGRSATLPSRRRRTTHIVLETLTGLYASLLDTSSERQC